MGPYQPGLDLPDLCKDGLIFLGGLFGGPMIFMYEKPQDHSRGFFIQFSDPIFLYMEQE